MTAATLWWLAFGALVVLELNTGTFYLLMLALGALAGALAAHGGLALTGQIVWAMAVALVALLACHVWRRSRRAASPVGSDVQHLDVGQTVLVTHWETDRTASVRHRGAPWTAVLPPGLNPQPGPHRVVELVGSRLLVEPVAAPASINP